MHWYRMHEVVIRRTSVYLQEEGRAEERKLTPESANKVRGDEKVAIGHCSSYPADKILFPACHFGVFGFAESVGSGMFARLHGDTIQCGNSSCGGRHHWQEAI